MPRGGADLGQRALEERDLPPCVPHPGAQVRSGDTILNSAGTRASTITHQAGSDLVRRRRGRTCNERSHLFATHARSS
jgi:hypothetical protein